MPDQPATEAPSEPADDEAASPAAAPARISVELAAVFGDVLPSQTSDDQDRGEDWADARRDGSSANDERLRRDVPPHHGS